VINHKQKERTQPIDTKEKGGQNKRIRRERRNKRPKKPNK
jgi:hypothetical protein